MCYFLLIYFRIALLFTNYEFLNIDFIIIFHFYFIFLFFHQ